MISSPKGPVAACSWPTVSTEVTHGLEGEYRLMWHKVDDR